MPRRLVLEFPEEFPEKDLQDKEVLKKAKPVGDKLREAGLRIKDKLYHQFLKEMGEG